jgi:uncharacterized phage protein (TIGR01671 family)
MTREIIFRGKRLDNGEWVYGSLLDGDIIVSGSVDVDEDYIGLNEWHSVHAETVGQFTGLKDKNDKKIYEGDIYKVTFGQHFWVHEVRSLGGRFGNMLFGILLYDNVSSDESGEYYTNKVRIHNLKSGKDVEIIGNIYENAELLEEKNQ